MQVSTSSNEQPRRPAAGEQAPPAGEPDPAPRPTRRVFTPAYKLATVAEYEHGGPRVADYLDLLPRGYAWWLKRREDTRRATDAAEKKKA